MKKQNLIVMTLCAFAAAAPGCNRSENANPAPAPLTTVPVAAPVAPAPVAAQPAVAAPAAVAAVPATPLTPVAEPAGPGAGAATAPPAATTEKPGDAKPGEATPTPGGKLGDVKLPTPEEAGETAAQQPVGPKAIRLFYGLIDQGRTTQAVAMMEGGNRAEAAKAYDHLESAKVVKIEEWERSSWPAGQEKYMVTANLKCKPEDPAAADGPPCGGYGDGPDTRFFTIKQGSLRPIARISTGP